MSNIHQAYINLAHEQLILDSNLERLLPEDGRQLASNFTSNLMSVLEMKALGKLAVYQSVDELAPGWSFLQPITTSHISGHYFSSPGKSAHIHLDIYSCKTFNWKEVIILSNKFFSLEEWSGNFIERYNSVNRAVYEISGIKGKILLLSKLKSAKSI